MQYLTFLGEKLNLIPFTDPEQFVNSLTLQFCNKGKMFGKLVNKSSGKYDWKGRFFYY